MHLVSFLNLYNLVTLISYCLAFIITNLICFFWDEKPASSLSKLRYNYSLLLTMYTSNRIGWQSFKAAGISASTLLI